MGCKVPGLCIPPIIGKEVVERLIDESGENPPIPLFSSDFSWKFGNCGG